MPAGGVMYDAVTGQRLPVMDANGKALGDGLVLSR